MIRHLLLFFALGCSAAPAAGPGTAWRLMRFSSPDAKETADTQLLLSSAEISGDRLLLRVGVQGVFGRGGAFLPPALSEQDAVLKVSGSARTLACIALDRAWNPKAETNLLPGEMLAATLAFHAPAGLAEKLVFLHVAGYAPVAFRCLDGAPLPLPDLARTPERWALDAQVDANTPGYDNMRLELGTARVWEGKITFAMSFRNAGRFPMKVTGSPGGGEAVLVSMEHEYFRKPSVTGAISAHIAPDSAWHPDETVTGTVTFPLPHPHAAGKMWLAFPGFPTVPLVFDDALHHWRVEQEVIAARGTSMVQLRARAEQELFDSVSAFWDSVSRELEKKDFATCAAHFEKPEECALLRRIDKMPLASLKLAPSAGQRLALNGDGTMRMRMELRYRFRGQPEEHCFMLVGGGRLRRLAEPQGWRVESLVLDLAPPWAQGYTAFGESRHFLIFYRPDGAQVRHAMATLEQLEASWDAISATGLKLADKYAAFLCQNADDHKMLTGDLALGTVEASVGGMAVVENDRFLTSNVAVYVNPLVFEGPGALQQRRRLRTALDHEMVHAALSPWTRTWMPGWLVEGAAVFLSGEHRRGNRALVDAMESGLTLRGLSEGGVLRDPQGDVFRLDLQYRLGAEAVAYIDSRWGTARLTELYRAFSLEFPDAWHGPFGVDYENEDGAAKRRVRIDLTQKMLRRVLGTSLDEIEAAVLKRLRR
ncbi:MAG: hypothetical protein K1X78_10805 [Verrucomicrobiaceae bacterium]|nr:hypothetical protein [Verrucomicrobiaceae bacterium]